MRENVTEPTASHAVARLARAFVVLAASLTYFGYVFQVRHPAFMTSGLSEWLDPYFLNAVAEHWYHSLLTFGDPSSPPMFFPAAGTIGYSTSLVLYAPFYAIVRPFLHPFTAYTVSMLLVMETGVLSLYAVFRAFLDLTFVEAVLLTAFFASSLNVINGLTGVWSQTASIFLVPPILLLALASGRLHGTRARVATACSSGVLATLLCAQDFYTGWFVLLLTTLLVGGAAIVADKRWLGDQLKRATHGERPRILGFTLGAIAGGLVFAWLYWRAYQEHPRFPEDQLLAALIPMHPSTWTGPLDSIRRLVVYPGRRSFSLVFLAGALTWVPWFRVPWRVRLFALWFLVVSTVVVILGAVKFDQYLGWRNYSIWKRLFLHVPGGGVIRDPKRIIYTYELFVVLLAGVFLAQLPRRSVLRVALNVVVLALLVVEPNREVFEFGRPIAVFDRWVSAPIDIDPSCQSFFMSPASREYESRYGHLGGLYGIDATFIALQHSLPTLNGYSAWFPPGWSLADPTHQLYPAAVRTWVTAHHLHGVCQLDIDARRMTPYDPD